MRWHWGRSHTYAEANVTGGRIYLPHIYRRQAFSTLKHPAKHPHSHLALAPATAASLACSLEYTSVKRARSSGPQALLRCSSTAISLLRDRCSDRRSSYAYMCDCVHACVGAVCVCVCVQCVERL